MKKLKILSLLPSLLLCSCGKGDRWAGLYQFRLGKSDGNHMEITIELTTTQDEKFSDYKVMNMSADLGDNMDPTSVLDDLEEAGEVIIPFLDLIGISIGDKFPKLMEVAKKELTDFTDIKLFYNVTSYQPANKSYRLDVGTHEIADRLEKIKVENPDLAEIIDEAKDYAKDIPFLDDNLNMPPERAKFLFNLFINKKGLTIQVPVSKEDIEMQMIWYGMNYPLFSSSEDKLLPADYMDKMPGAKGENRFGTHPLREVKNNVVIKDEVAEVNTIFKKEFSKTILTTELLDGPELGRFIIETINNERHLVFLFAGEPTSTVEGYVNFTNLKFVNVPESGDLGVIEGAGTKAIIKGADDKEYKINDFFINPFEFRDFNIVDVGLAKVTE